jgi:hypothetical protein
MATGGRQAAFAASIAAASAIVLVAGPAPSQADPPLPYGPLKPLAPPCTQWDFDDNTSLKQKNGWGVFIKSGILKAHGAPQWRVQALKEDFDSWRITPGQGTLSGRIDGSSVNLFVQWDSGPAGPYVGSVDANGFAHGDTYDVNNPGSSSRWDSDKPLRCISS